jgi:hypothetical protein
MTPMWISYHLKRLFSADFASLPNGALQGFQGATFAVSNGVVTNTPSVGAELLTNPQLTGTYSSGLAPNTFKLGSPTLAESADGHGDTKAQAVTAVAQSNKVGHDSKTPVAGGWYLYGGWGKNASAGSTNQRMQLEQNNLVPQGTTSAMAIKNSTYTRRQTSSITSTTAALTGTTFFEVGTSGFTQCIVDDFSLKRLTDADLFALRPATQANVIAKIQPNTLSDQTLSGVVARANAQSSPTSELIAFYRWNGNETSIVISLVEFISGVLTVKITEQSITEVTGAWLELRVNGSTAQVFYNNAQVGTNQTITVTGAVHGMCITGGNNIKQFAVFGL